jgi:hypothetical protein
MTYRHKVVLTILVWIPIAASIVFFSRAAWHWYVSSEVRELVKPECLAP